MNKRALNKTTTCENKLNLVIAQASTDDIPNIRIFEFAKNTAHNVQWLPAGRSAPSDCSAILFDTTLGVENLINCSDYGFDVPVIAISHESDLQRTDILTMLFRNGVCDYIKADELTDKAVSHSVEKAHLRLTSQTSDQDIIEASKDIKGIHHNHNLGYENTSTEQAIFYKNLTKIIETSLTVGLTHDSFEFILGKAVEAIKGAEGGSLLF